jgi:hypothetical protein
MVITMVTEVLSPPVGSALLNSIGPYATFTMELPLLILGLFVIPYIPQLKTEAASDGRPSSPGTSENRQNQVKRNQIFRRVVVFIRQDFASIMNERALILGIFALAFQKFSQPISGLMLQYMSKKFDWKLSEVPATTSSPRMLREILTSFQAAYILSLQAAGQIVLFIWVVPYVYKWLLRQSGSNVANANLTLARLCVFSLALGCLLMAFAPIAPVFIIGM